MVRETNDEPERRAAVRSMFGELKRLLKTGQRANPPDIAVIAQKIAGAFIGKTRFAGRNQVADKLRDGIWAT